MKRNFTIEMAIEFDEEGFQNFRNQPGTEVSFVVSEKMYKANMIKLSGPCFCCGNKTVFEEAAK